MIECLNTTLIPLSKVVSAAIVDTREDIGKVQQVYSHWASRRMRTLQRQTLKMGKRNVTLHVNRNTMTATLPPDFRKELFIGYLNDKGIKIPLPLNVSLTNEQSIEDIPCDDACPKCNQSKSICNDLIVTESERIVIVNDGSYIENTIKKLYADGSYYLEKTIPYYNTVTQTVEYTTVKKYITELDLKDCGCLETTPENMVKVQTYCPDVYGCYYASCSNVCDRSQGGYRVFEETGQIQLERKFTHEKLYIEYTGFLPKINGQLSIPEVAFETVVKGVVVDALSSKGSSVSGFDKQWAQQRYEVARKAMDKEKGLISLDRIMQAISLMPKFDIGYHLEYDCCGTRPQVTILDARVSDICETNNMNCNIGSGRYLAPFVFSAIVDNGAGTPVANQNEIISSDLIDAVNIETLVIDNNTYTKKRGDFTFDPQLGKIVMQYPLQSQSVLIIPYAKFINQ